MTGTIGKLRDYFHVSYQPGERRLLQKIDFFILTFCCLSYFTNYLDRTNLANAYVTGMREDLSFTGSQFNQINTCFTIGYILGQLPSNLALRIFRPRFWFPSLMLLWAALTMATAAARRPQDIMAIRFFLGLAEASTFVGTHYILGAWYTEKELGKRTGVFTASGLVGTMIGGFIQTGIWERLDGRHGLSGWRWLFVIDGLVTLPVAAWGFVLFPDTPETTRAVYLTQQQKELARERMRAHRGISNAQNGKDGPGSRSHRPGSASPTAQPNTNTQSSGNPTSDDKTNHDQYDNEAPGPHHRRLPSLATFTTRTKTLLRSHHWWGFVILWILAGETESFSTNSLLALYMKTPPPPPTGRAYTVPQLNTYPTGVPAVGIISTLFWATLTDALGGHRDLAGYFVGLTAIGAAIMVLVARHEAESQGKDVAATVFAAYYMAGAVYACQATFFAWCNDAMRREEEWKRAAVLAGMNLGSNAVNAWWLIVFYGAEMAPWFERGMYAMIAVSVALVVWCAGLSGVLKRDERRWAAESQPQVPVELYSRGQDRQRDGRATHDGGQSA